MVGAGTGFSFSQSPVARSHPKFYRASAGGFDPMNAQERVAYKRRMAARFPDKIELPPFEADLWDDIDEWNGWELTEEHWERFWFDDWHPSTLKPDDPIARCYSYAPKMEKDTLPQLKAQFDSAVPEPGSYEFFTEEIAKAEQFQKRCKDAAKRGSLRAADYLLALVPQF